MTLANFDKLTPGKDFISLMGRPETFKVYFVHRNREGETVAIEAVEMATSGNVSNRVKPDGEVISVLRAQAVDVIGYYPLHAA